jgi:NAD(P)-dependent dehydrogenase (short-subunit alcohol dehydrogenase family)
MDHSNGTVLVTGPTSGIGREIARQLNAGGFDLVLACRDQEAGERVAAELRQDRPGAAIRVMRVDVSSADSIRQLGSALRREAIPLDALVNNAGMHAAQRRCTPTGVELTFATNVLGYFLLSLELRDRLETAVAIRGQARVVNVASTFATTPDLEDLQFESRPFVGKEAYSQSKACNRMLTRALARRLEGSGVTVNSMAPGLIQTALFRETKPFTRLMVRMAGFFFGRTVEEGADTAVWLTTSGDVKGRSGGFYSKRQEVVCAFAHEPREERLWTLCESLASREP